MLRDTARMVVTPYYFSCRSAGIVHIKITEIIIMDNKF